MTKPMFGGLLTEMQKKFGENVVMRGSEIVIGPAISTGSLALDYATSYGGVPSNRVMEIYGRAGTGKTTLALLTMLNALEKSPDRGALFLDVEHKITPDWLELIVGRDIMENRMIYVSPTSIEHATNLYRDIVGSGQVCCAILDSIGGAPTVRRNDDAEVALVGGNAQGVGHFAQSAATYSDVFDCLTIGVNQIMHTIGRMAFNDATPGGEKWKHACILRIELVRGKDTETITLPGEEKPVPIGYTVSARVRKNQVGPEGRTAWWWFFNTWTEQHGFGVDQLDEINRLAIKTQVVQKKGGWYHHPALPVDSKGEHKVQGILGLQELVRDDESLRATIVSEVMASLGDHAGEVAPVSDLDTDITPEGQAITGMEKLWLEGG